MNARRWRKKIKNDAIYIFVRLLVSAVRLLSLEAARRLMACFGQSVYAVAPQLRRLSHENLRLAFGDSLDERSIRALARQVFRDLGANAADALKLDQLRLETFVKAEHFEVVEAALARGHGLLLAAGHVGNWELLGAFLAGRGVPLTALAARIYDPRLDRLVHRLRLAVGVKTLRHNRSGLGSARVLKRGEALGVLIDLRQERSGQTVHFLGHPAHTVDGPFHLAVRLRVPVVFAAAWREGDGRYRAYFEKLEPPTELETQQQVNWLLKACTERLEEVVRCVPTQWIWMHPRWQPVARGKVRQQGAAADFAEGIEDKP